MSTKASIPSQCRDVSISRASNKNSDKTNYTITFRQKSDFIANSYLNIVLPTALGISNNTACVYNLTTILSCDIVSNSINIQLPSQIINSLTFLSISLTNILNLASYQPLVDIFSLLTKTPDNINKYCQYSVNTTFTNTVPS